MSVPPPEGGGKVPNVSPPTQWGESTADRRSGVGGSAVGTEGGGRGELTP